MGWNEREIIHVGQSVPTNRLLDWSTEAESAARRLHERLERRHVDGGFLDRLVELRKGIQSRREHAQEPSWQTPEWMRSVYNDAIEFWRETKLMAKAEFGSEPDVLAQFRTGVRIGASVERLASEISGLLPLLRRHRAQLEWLGVDDAFLNRGETLVARLQEVIGELDVARAGMSRETVELYALKGELYDLTRKLIRVGRLEFRNEPTLVAQFNYAPMRPEAAARAAKTKTTAR